MLKTSMDFSERLRERTMNFAIEIYNLIKEKNISYQDRPIITQLIKSSTSVAANYRAATCGRSDEEFYSKICIVLEECDETLFWITFLFKIGLINKNEASKFLQEAHELTKMFSSSKTKMKRKIALRNKKKDLTPDT